MIFFETSAKTGQNVEDVSNPKKRINTNIPITVLYKNNDGGVR